MLTVSARDRKSPAGDSPFHGSPSSISGTISKHVVVVMDGMAEFTTETLQRTLDNVVTAGCIVTLLGVMPWLNIPLFLKTMNDFWMGELEDASLVKEKSECGNDVKHLKCQAVINLCRKYGVMPQKKIVMGYPLRLRVVEQIMTLYPTWVVFDRYHGRNRDFYARKIPCNILMMKDDGKVDMVKCRVMNHNGESTSTSLASTPQVLVSEESKKERDEIDQKNCRKWSNNWSPISNLVERSLSNMRHSERDSERECDNSRQGCWN